MRLIGTLDNERKALTFSRFLHHKGIANQVEVEANTNWDSTAYGSHHCQVWIQDEEHTQEVLQWFQSFVNNPEDPLFTPFLTAVSWKNSTSPHTVASKNEPPSALKTETQSWSKQPMGWITRALLGICTFLFFLSQLVLPAMQAPEKYSGLVLFSSPVEKALLYDYPKFFELINRFIDLYGYEELEQPENLPEEGKYLLQKINHTSFWPGYYKLLLKGGWESVREGLDTYPTFEKIQEGQLWRLFSPCLLHGDIFHLFFNMLWLIVLGKQMEQRLTPGRYVAFILIVGVISNTAQYLMSGPNFIGFSGIVVGMLAFIWARQKKAAWEGYQIDRLTFIFMLIFILSMAALQFLSFFVEKSFEMAFAPNIANMAHVMGGVVGYLLGRLNFFSWRHV